MPWPTIMRFIIFLECFYILSLGLLEQISSRKKIYILKTPLTCHCSLKHPFIFHCLVDHWPLQTSQHSPSFSQGVQSHLEFCLDILLGVPEGWCAEASDLVSKPIHPLRAYCLLHLHCPLGLVTYTHGVDYMQRDPEFREPRVSHLSSYMYQNSIVAIALLEYLSCDFSYNWRLYYDSPENHFHSDGVCHKTPGKSAQEREVEDRKQFEWGLTYNK